MKHWFLLLVYLFIGCVNFAIAQNSTINILNASTADTTFFNNDSTIYTIGEILLKGNKTTKSYTIYREVPFKQGDKLSAKQLTEHLVLAKNQIMNTSLFLDVTVYVSNIINNVATIQINVKERWYIFPLPYFKLADRNFSQWWYDHKASLNRVNYGLKFFHNNISGRNDKLTVNLITGYSQQVQLGYANPFLDKKLKHGFSVVLNYLRQKEMNYATINHKQVFVKSDDFIRESAMGLFTYSYRPDSKFRFLTTLGIYHLNIADTVLQLNPHYLPEYKK